MCIFLQAYNLHRHNAIQHHRYQDSQTETYTAEPRQEQQHHAGRSIIDCDSDSSYATSIQYHNAHTQISKSITGFFPTLHPHVLDVHRRLARGLGRADGESRLGSARAEIPLVPATRGDGVDDLVAGFLQWGYLSYDRCARAEETEGFGWNQTLARLVGLLS